MRNTYPIIPAVTKKKRRPTDGGPRPPYLAPLVASMYIVEGLIVVVRGASSSSSVRPAKAALRVQFSRGRRI